MKTKFDKYIKKKFKGKDGFKRLFFSWDFEDIIKESKEWKPDNWLFVYVTVNKTDCRTPHAWVGCNSNINEILKKYKETEEEETPKTSKIMLYFVIPPFRNYSSKKLKHACKKGRGWLNKCKLAIEIAKKRGLNWKISREICDKESKFFIQDVADTIKNLGEDIYI